MHVYSNDPFEQENEQGHFKAIDVLEMTLGSVFMDAYRMNTN